MSDLQIVQRRAFFRPRGTANAYQLADLITDALLRAYGEYAGDAVVDIRQTSGFESPGPAYRRWAVRRWSETVRNKLRVAIVARAEHICPDKVGLLTAAEEGLDAGIFEHEADALAWLDAAAPVAHARPGDSRIASNTDDA
jgi:hypothetical protein